MGDAKLTPADLEKLAEWDTPTICNGLEHLSAEYRVKSFTVENMRCFDPSLKPIVGYARTAMIRAMTPAEGSPADIRAMRARYYETIAADPAPSISVIQDLDPIPGFGAFWGEVNTAIHRASAALAWSPTARSGISTPARPAFSFWAARSRRATPGCIWWRSSAR